MRDVRFFKDDPLVLRILGLRLMPSASTISRQLASIDDRCVAGIERVQQKLVLETLARENLPRIRWILMAVCWARTGELKVLPVVGILKIKASKAITRYFAPSLN